MYFRGHPLRGTKINRTVWYSNKNASQEHCWHSGTSLQQIGFDAFHDINPYQHIVKSFIHRFNLRWQWNQTIRKPIDWAWLNWRRFHCYSNTTGISNEIWISSTCTDVVRGTRLLTTITYANRVTQLRIYAKISTWSVVRNRQEYDETMSKICMLLNPSDSQEDENLSDYVLLNTRVWNSIVDRFMFFN